MVSHSATVRGSPPSGSRVRSAGGSVAMAQRTVARAASPRQIVASERRLGSVPAVHPIERLRYVARASGAPQAVLVRETAAALGSLAFDPAGLVTACRRVLDRHPACGSLWWLAAHVLTTVGDPDEEGWRCADELEDDPTADELAHALPHDARVVRAGLARAHRRGPGPPGRRRGARRRRPRRGLRARPPAPLRYGVDATDVPVSGLGAAVRRGRPRAARGVRRRPRRRRGRRRVAGRRRRGPAVRCAGLGRGGPGPAPARAACSTRCWTGWPSSTATSRGERRTKPSRRRSSTSSSGRPARSRPRSPSPPPTAPWRPSSSAPSPDSDPAADTRPDLVDEAPMAKRRDLIRMTDEEVEAFLDGRQS